MRPPAMIAVVGPTGSGKTAFAERLADRLDGHLINADAFQVYRGMDVGTAKPEAKSRYSLIDICNPSEQFGVGQFIALARDELSSAFERNRSCIVVGGSGLYVRALFEGYADLKDPPDPALREALTKRMDEEGLLRLVEVLKARDFRAYEEVDRQNPRRVLRALERTYVAPRPVDLTPPPFVHHKIGLEANTQVLDRRIEERVRKMVQNGWIREVESLRKKGFGLEDPGLKAIGYREIWLASIGQMELEQAIAKTIVLTKQYAKRQRTWLRKEPNLVRLDALDADALDRKIVELGDLH